MFQNDSYVTRGIKEKINKKNPVTFLLLWDLIDEMAIAKKDYMQIFILRTGANKKGIQEIEHIQEEPPYRNIHRYFTASTIDAKIYVIDDGEHSTMMLAEEYYFIKNKL